MRVQAIQGSAGRADSPLLPDGKRILKHAMLSFPVVFVLRQAQARWATHLDRRKELLVCQVLG